MASDINLKELWNRQSVQVPNSAEIIGKANGYKRKHLKKLMMSNIMLVATSVFIIWVVYNYDYKMPTTPIGTTLVIAAMAIYLVVYNRILPLLLKSEPNMSTAEYLQQLLKLKAKQKFLQTTMLSLYYILLSVGVFLYMIEPTSGRSIVGRIIVYGITLAWMLFSWFYFRRRAIRKQEQAINELIEKFEGMQKQLESK